MKNKRTFPLLMLIWVSFLFSANAFSQRSRLDLSVKIVAVKNGNQIDIVDINKREFQLIATVKNSGSQISESTKLLFYRYFKDKDPPYSRKLGDITIPRLRGHASKRYSLKTKAPSSIGEHYYRAYVLPVESESKSRRDNNWSTVSIYVAKGLEPPPPDFISDVAFTQNATYFVVNPQFLKLKSEEAIRPTYGICGITLDIPGVQSDPIALKEYKDSTDSSLDAPSYFMYPLQSLNVRKRVREDEESKIQNVKEKDWLGIVTGWAGYVAGGVIGGAIGSVFPGAGTTAGVVLGAKIIGGVAGYALGVVYRVEKLATLEDNEVIGILEGTADPTLTLHPREVSGTVPPEITQVLFFIPDRQVQILPITIKQAFRPAGTEKRLAATRIIDWNLSETAAAAPHAQPMSLADYPPFQRLSPEAQEHLLRQLGEPAPSEAWQIPETTTLLPNYPNPFNPETWIPYHLAEPADVTLTLYDLHGRVVRDLDLGHQPAGVYQSRSRAAYWDGRNAWGEPVASGVYFYTLKAGDFSATRKLLIRK